MANRTYTIIKVEGEALAVDPYYIKCSDEELANWKHAYETLIRDNSPESGKTFKTPQLIPGWQRGLEVVNKIISDRQRAGKQLTIFNQ